MRAVRILLYATGSVVGLLIAAFLVSWLLIPAERSFDNQVDIDAPADEVWKVIKDRKGYAEWQSDIDRVDLVSDNAWIEYPRNSPEPLHFTLQEDNSPKHMIVEYAMGDSFSGRWRGEISERNGGVRLTTRDSYSSTGWLTKTMVFIFFDLDKFAKNWNQRLKQRVEDLSNKSK